VTAFEGELDRLDRLDCSMSGRLVRSIRSAASLCSLSRCAAPRVGMWCRERQSDRGGSVYQAGWSVTPHLSTRVEPLSGHPSADQVVARMDRGPQCPSPSRQRAWSAQPVLHGAQVVGQNRVTGVAHGVKQPLGATPDFECIELESDDEGAGLEQSIDPALTENSAPGDLAADRIENVNNAPRAGLVEPDVRDFPLDHRRTWGLGVEDRHPTTGRQSRVRPVASRWSSRRGMQGLPPNRHTGATQNNWACVRARVVQ
jgi:hypothetical protein